MRFLILSSSGKLLLFAYFDKVEGIKNNEIADAMAIVESPTAGNKSFHNKPLVIHAVIMMRKIIATIFSSSMKAAFGLLSSGGELALVVAKGGVNTGLTSAFLLPMIDAMTIITTFISPYMNKLGWKVPDRVFSKKEEKDKKEEDCYF